MKIMVLIWIYISMSLTACSSENTPTNEEIIDPVVTTGELAEVLAVSANGEENQYSFAVTIKSPDTGCQNYADWWEIITPEGVLVYRRILAHSHVNEQPFTRSGGPVAITNDQVVFIRAHMNTSGYGEKIYKGSVAQGFSTFNLESQFDEELEKEQPLPSGCAF